MFERAGATVVYRDATLFVDFDAVFDQRRRKVRPLTRREFELLRSSWRTGTACCRAIDSSNACGGSIVKSKPDRSTSTGTAPQQLGPAASRSRRSLVSGYRSARMATDLASRDFACVHNAGRSQMAAALFNALCDPNKARASSARDRAAERVHPAVVTAMQGWHRCDGSAAHAAHFRTCRDSGSSGDDGCGEEVRWSRESATGLAAAGSRVSLRSRPADPQPDRKPSFDSSSKRKTPCRGRDGSPDYSRGVSVTGRISRLNASRHHQPPVGGPGTQPRCVARGPGQEPARLPRYGRSRTGQRVSGTCGRADSAGPGGRRHLSGWAATGRHDVASACLHELPAWSDPDGPQRLRASGL